MVVPSSLSQSVKSYARTTTRMRPRKALRAVRALIANPEDTRQAFIITEALRGRSGQWMFKRFCSSPGGAEILAKRLSLLQTLQDRGRLDRLPRGTLGRAYADFMGSQNLTADGLVEAAEAARQRELPPDGLVLRNRMRDNHDLYHVVTGYGRDPLGEVCVLAFTYAHTRNAGLGLLVLMAAAQIGRKLRSASVWRAVWEAWRHGRRSAWFPQQVWETLMERPLEEVRRTLRVRPARHYADLVRKIDAYVARNPGVVVTA